MGYDEEKLETKYVPPYFYEFRAPYLFNPVGLIHFHPTSLNQIMEFQPTLDDIMAKIDNVLQLMNSLNQNSKSSIPCMIPTFREFK